jgi:hypothetical protein
MWPVHAARAGATAQHAKPGAAGVARQGRNVTRIIIAVRAPALTARAMATEILAAQPVTHAKPMARAVRVSAEVTAAARGFRSAAQLANPQLAPAILHQPRQKKGPPFSRRRSPNRPSPMLSMATSRAPRIIAISSQNQTITATRCVNVVGASPRSDPELDSRLRGNERKNRGDSIS